MVDRRPENKKDKLPRHIIFCERIQDVSKIYTLFVKIFGNNCDLFDMFHSKTSEKVKDKIRKDMNTDGKFLCVPILQGWGSISMV